MPVTSQKSSSSSFRDRIGVYFVVVDDNDDDHDDCIDSALHCWRMLQCLDEYSFWE